MRVRVREVVEVEQRQDGLVERAHLEKRHLAVFLNVVEAFHKAVLRKEAHERVLIALEVKRDARDVQQRHGRDGLLWAATAVPVQWRASKVTRIIELKGVHFAARHGHGHVLRVVHAQLLAKDLDAVQVVERGRRLADRETQVQSNAVRIEPYSLHWNLIHQ